MRLQVLHDVRIVPSVLMRPHVRIDISRLHAMPCRDEEFDLRRFAGLLLPVRFRVASCRPEALLYLKQHCYIGVG